MALMLGDITVETTIDLEYYRDDVIGALQPDDIDDALQFLEECWGYTDVDVLGCLLQDMDSDLLIEKLSECLDVSSALTLVERLHEYTISFSKQRENTKDNHIKDLKDKVDNLLAVCNHTVIKEAEELGNNV
jgi:hypothetical protein